MRLRNSSIARAQSSALKASLKIAVRIQKYAGEPRSTFVPECPSSSMKTSIAIQSAESGDRTRLASSENGG
jgi:hypothetical protein